MAQLCLEQSVERPQWLFVVANGVELVCREPGFGQAVFDGLLWESGVMSHPCEAFFLRSGDDLAVHYERCGAVMVKCGYPENGCHGSEQRVDEGSDGRAR